VARNPVWKRDELLLALELYLEKGQLGPDDEDVIGLSQLMNQLPLHIERPDVEKFRNPNGVALKLANFRHLDPSDPAKGMSSVGKGDQQVWDEFSDHIETLKKITSGIREASTDDEPIPSQPEEDEDGVAEGKILYRLHRRRERNPSKSKEKKRKAFAENGRLVCEVCSFDFVSVYGQHGEGFIECHHKVPISEPNRGKTKLSDLALVCANCHRMLHRGKPWPTVEELKNLMAR
tara:strand:- start:3928 stop:4629 length:702 start_codon:yes stop_codon:yes gene_type:complete